MLDNFYLASCIADASPKTTLYNIENTNNTINIDNTCKRY